MPSPDSLPEKHCAVCGRRMRWRKRWARSWDGVRYCSARCRGRGLGRVDRALERALVRLLEERAASASLSPSEVARAVAPEGRRPPTEAARAAGRRLAVRGVVVFTRDGRTLDPSTAKGPVRLARGPGWAARHEGVRP